MAILETEAVQLSNAVRDAMVALRTLVNGNQITNNLLETTDKTDLVSAVNELKASIDALSYDDLADLPTIPATVAELTDATTYDFPTLNTPVANALAAKANSTDLGSIATFEGNQPLRTTDPATFAGITIPFPSVADFTDTFSGNVRKCQINSSGVALRSDKMIRWSVNTSSSTADSGIGRGSIPASVAIGNSAAGDASGTVQCANLTASGAVTGSNFEASDGTRRVLISSIFGQGKVYSQYFYISSSGDAGANSKVRIGTNADGDVFFMDQSGASYRPLFVSNLTASGTVTLDGLARPSWTYAPVTDTSTVRSLTIAADLWKRLRFSNVGAITITVPENSTQAFPIGYTIPIRRVAGAGAITIAVAGGVTVNGSAGSTSVPAGGDFALHKIATDTWDFI
jgi:hypothetical protein